MDIINIKKYCETIFSFSFCLYIIGFLIINTSLLEFGVHTEDIFSVSYLIASLLFLFLVGVSSLPIWAIRKDKKNNFFISLPALIGSLCIIFLIFYFLFGHDLIFIREAYRDRGGRNIIFGLVIFIIIPDIIYAIIKNKIKHLFPSLLVFHVLFLLIYLRFRFSLLIIFNSFIIYIIKSKIKMSESDIKVARFIKTIVPHAIIIIVMFFILEAILFGNRIYALTNRNMGGGKPLNVKLLINEGEAARIRLTGIEINKDGWSQEVKLIHKGRDSIYLEGISPNKYSCIEIKNSLVKIILYLGNKFNLKNFWGTILNSISGK